MRTTTFMIFILGSFLNCQHAEKPFLYGKWRVIRDSKPSFHNKIYNTFTTNKVYIERVLIDSTSYEMHGDTMIMNSLRDSTERDMGLLKWIGNDTIWISSQKGIPYYFIVRQKEH